jgi:hypothetical protein
MEWADNASATFGSSADLDISHNGTNSYIDNATGTLYIRNEETSGGGVYIQVDDTGGAAHNVIRATGGVAAPYATLYYDNGAVLDTVSGGISVTGNITVSGTVDGRDIAADGATLDGITQYVHPTYNGDDINIDTGALTGVTVISDLDFNITTDTQGHVVDANGAVSTRNLTLGNFGITASAGEINELDGAGTLWHNGNDLLSYSSSNSSSGYIKIPNGLYIQWGVYTNSSSGYHTVSFPVSFPSYCFTVASQVGVQYADNAWRIYGGNWSRTKSGFTTYTSSSIATMTYIAVGI